VSDPRQLRWGVPVAALALVAASWAALQLARSPESLDDGGDAVTGLPELPVEVPGFRADAWFLPDEPLLGFAEIPAGPFVMGTDPSVDPLAFDVERWSAATAQGTLELPTYYVARYEVTVAQYRAFVRATGYRVVDQTAVQGDPRLPVTGVAWTDALAYARWLGEALGSWPGAIGVLGSGFVIGWTALENWLDARAILGASATPGLLLVLAGSAVLTTVSVVKGVELTRGLLRQREASRAA